MFLVGFGTNDRWTSKLIRWATKSKWSHTWIEYPEDVWGGRWAVHAWEDGVVKIPNERIRASYPEQRAYECQEDLSQGLTWARQYIGAPYDYGVIWNGLLLVVYGATGWRWLYDVVHRNAAKFSCSEFVAGVLKASSVPGTQDIDPELATPGELERFCSTSQSFWVV